jgi:hypothetical protein
MTPRDSLTPSATNVKAAEKTLIRYIEERREPRKLTDAGARSTLYKTGAQVTRELEFVRGMCEGLFRFTGRDLTPSGLLMRMQEAIRNDR